jgi:hypothetical protein
MKTIFLCLLITLLPVALTAQGQTKDLSFKSGTWTYNYYLDGEQVPFDTFINELNENNAEAGNMFNSGKNLSVTGMVIGSLGAFCFGYDLGTRLGGGEGSMPLLAGGGGVMLGGIIMYYVGEGKMKKALTLFENNSTSLYMGPTSTGIGLCFNF